MRAPNEIDFWRGFALVTIFVNHIPGNFFERFTYRNLSLADSAELFVFLAGWSLRLVTERAASASAPEVFLRLCGRAVNVYVAQLVITEFALAILAGAAVLLDAPFLLDWHNASAVFHQPVETHIGLVLLLHQLGYFNILPLYVVLMAAAPFIALTFRYAPRLVLPLALAIYVATLASGFNLPTWPVEGTWFFNPCAWQLIFVLGFLLAGEKTGLGHFARTYRRYLFWAAIPVVGFGIFIGITHYSPEPANVPSPKLFFVFDKTFLSPARLVHMLALATVFAGSFRLINKVFPRCCTYLSSLGRNSLNVFCVGSILSLIGQILRFAYGGLIALDVGMLMMGLIIMGIVAWISEWRERLRPPAAGLRVSSSASA